MEADKKIYDNIAYDQRAGMHRVSLFS